MDFFCLENNGCISKCNNQWNLIADINFPLASKQKKVASYCTIHSGLMFFDWYVIEKEHEHGLNVCPFIVDYHEWAYYVSLPTWMIRIDNMKDLLLVFEFNINQSDEVNFETI